MAPGSRTASITAAPPGGSDHSFNGDTGITRAEVAVILCQLNGLA